MSLNVMIRRKRPQANNTYRRGDVLYTDAEFLEAYFGWAHTDPEMRFERNDAWDNYCDVRDGLEKGSSKERRILMRSRDIANFHDLDS